MNTNRKKPQKMIFIFFLLFPLFFQIPGFLIQKNISNIISNGIQTQWIVVDVKVSSDDDGTTYSPILEYTCWSEDIMRWENNMYSSSYPQIWESISIYCLKWSTKFVRDTFSSKYFWYFFILWPGIMQLIGAVGLFLIWRTQRKNQHLIKNGREITAKVVYIWYDTTFEVNGRNAMQVTCQYTDKDNNSVYEFKSDRIWLHDISEYAKVGDQRTVFVAIKGGETDFSKYYVDIRDIPVAK